MADQIKLVVVSDLHYQKHQNSEVRPAATSRGAGAYDPVAAFVSVLETNNVRADYVVCPGDITDRACKEGLRSGWESLNAIKVKVGARHLIAATGNHEVNSRAGDAVHDRAGNAEAEVDPLGMLQEIPEYPSSIWNGDDRDWVYWGRGYEFIEDNGILFLLINSSHFHPTMKINEFERGRISDQTLRRLAGELAAKIEVSKPRVCIAILHHPPINHDSLLHDLGRIEMFNGGRLIEVLDKSGWPWLIIHGHKHDGRLVMAQGAGYQPIVFAAGSIGADLQGHQAGIYTKLQGYVITLDLCSDHLPALRGTVCAYAWLDNKWELATHTHHGIPNGCGFSSPTVNPHTVATQLRDHALNNRLEYLNLSEIYELVPDFKYLMPGQVKMFKDAVQRMGGKFTWEKTSSYPDDVTFEGVE
ncbi:metallophosphoesterase family protein [Xanthomonas euvesicatoria]|uniref:metallophosphoesterase family protein n=1 Tax=Xanthomonas euvesicatoria TaxID=456327 RepID=UPI0024056CAB|nr:metallophosphoesterase [Xanthomonas euvesicatoria pv. allii]